MKHFEHAVVVGASSGIGEALARRLAHGGARVALVARRREELERLAGEIRESCGEDRAVVLPHDVRDRAAAPAVLQEAAQLLGGLDLVVFNSGIMPVIGEQEYDTERDAEVVEVNLLGAMAWLNPAAERFARLGRGTIVGIGSIAGDRGRAGNPAYNTSKAALHTYLEALRNRVARHGVRVVTIKPGFVATQMVHGRSGLFWVVTAERAAQLILRAAQRGRVTAYVPGRWRMVSLALRAVPSFVFRRLKV